MKKTKGAGPKKREIILEGIPASPGIVIGPCFLYSEPLWQPEPKVVSRKEVPEQIKCFRQLVQESHDQLQRSFQKTKEQFGDDLAELLALQVAFLEDEIFLKEVEELIQKNRYEAAYATFTVFRKKKDYFLQLSNDYFRDRAFDIQNLKYMIIKNILGEDCCRSISLKTPSIVVADNLSPSDTIQLHEQHVLGLTTNTGGKPPHTAIVARSLGVPAIVGLKKITESVQTGDTLVLDGNNGKVIINPALETISAYEEQRRIFINLEEQLLQESALETKTRDGKRIHLHANIEFEDELAHLMRVGADGIGLFRTEGLFLNRRELPSEDDQAEIYRRLAEAMYPRKVVIRTLDLGGDKVAPGLINSKEQNPFLGWRAIRFWLDHKTGFLAQLKAILRANLKDNVQILLPMVSSLGEIYQVKELLDQASATLKKEGQDYGKSIELGIMIEIPSVVVMADILAHEVDFFSIGTNDLVQYTLAVDRGNEKVAYLYSHFHPAVLRMIKMTIDAGKKANIPVGMCGEMAGDPLAVPILLAMGFEYLSASHTVIPEIKKIIRELSLPECEKLYREIQPLAITKDIIEVVRQFFRSHFPNMYHSKKV